MTEGSLIPLLVDGLIYTLQAHGGISRNFNALLGALARTKRVEILLVLRPGTPCPSALENLLTVEWVPFAAPLRPRRLFGPWNRYRTDILRRRYWSVYRTGLFHSTYYSTQDELRIPQVQSFQDAIYERYPALFSTPKHLCHVQDKQACVARADALLFPSEASLRECAVYYNTEGKQQAVIPYAVDPRFLRPPDSVQIEAFRAQYVGGEPFLFHSGARSLHKNFFGLLMAYAQWEERSSVRLVTAGGGPASDEERQAVERNGLSDRVVFLPYLEEDELITAYYASVAFIFPSLYEGFGFPLLEAMAAARPVASARTGSLPEVGKAIPIYFDPEDVEDMVRALDELWIHLQDQERWQGGRRIAEERSWDDVASDVLVFYNQILNFR